MSRRPQRWRSSSDQNQVLLARIWLAEHGASTSPRRVARNRDTLSPRRLEPRALSRIVSSRSRSSASIGVPSHCSTARNVAVAWPRDRPRSHRRATAFLRRDRHQGEADAHALRGPPAAQRQGRAARRGRRGADHAHAQPRLRRDRRRARHRDARARLRRAVAGARDGASRGEARRAGAHRRTNSSATPSPASASRCARAASATARASPSERAPSNARSAPRCSRTRRASISTTPRSPRASSCTKARAYLCADEVRGPAGLPLGIEGGAIALLSGGFDSAVAAWQMLRRGVRLDYLFCNLGGRAHELGVLRVAKVLADRWSLRRLPAPARDRLRAGRRRDPRAERSRATGRSC